MLQTPRNRTAVLRKTPLFADLAENELRYIADRIVSREFTAGEIVFSEGDFCKGLWVVESGKVKVFKAAASGREQVLTFEGPCSSIAELPVFDGGTYPASAMAMADSTLLFVSKEDFRLLCINSPEAALKVLRVVGGRLRSLIGIIEELSFSTVRGRLAALLLRLARHGNRLPGGVEIALPANQQEVAAQIGTVRELVSRGLGRLQAQGTIEIEGRNIVIRDLRALESEIEESS
jgi:CRP/FNR family transcriptional regulator